MSASNFKKTFKMPTTLFVYPKLILEIKIRILEGWKTKKNNVQGLKSIILNFSGMKNKKRDQKNKTHSFYKNKIY